MMPNYDKQYKNIPAKGTVETSTRPELVPQRNAGTQPRHQESLLSEFESIGESRSNNNGRSDTLRRPLPSASHFSLLASSVTGRLVVALLKALYEPYHDLKNAYDDLQGIATHLDISKPETWLVPKTLAEFLEKYHYLAPEAWRADISEFISTLRKVDSIHRFWVDANEILNSTELDWCSKIFAIWSNLQNKGLADYIPLAISEWIDSTKKAALSFNDYFNTLASLNAEMYEFPAERQGEYSPGLSERHNLPRSLRDYLGDISAKEGSKRISFLYKEFSGIAEVASISDAVAKIQDLATQGLIPELAEGLACVDSDEPVASTNTWLSVAGGIQSRIAKVLEKDSTSGSGASNTGTNVADEVSFLGPELAVSLRSGLRIAANAIDFYKLIQEIYPEIERVYQGGSSVPAKLAQLCTVLEEKMVKFSGPLRSVTERLVVTLGTIVKLLQIGPGSTESQNLENLNKALSLLSSFLDGEAISSALGIDKAKQLKTTINAFQDSLLRVQILQNMPEESRFEDYLGIALEDKNLNALLSDSLGTVLDVANDLVEAAPELRETLGGFAKAGSLKDRLPWLLKILKSPHYTELMAKNLPADFAKPYQAAGSLLRKIDKHLDAKGSEGKIAVLADVLQSTEFNTLLSSMGAMIPAQWKASTSQYHDGFLFLKGLLPYINSNGIVYSDLKKYILSFVSVRSSLHLFQKSLQIASSYSSTITNQTLLTAIEEGSRLYLEYESSQDSRSFSRKAGESLMNIVGGSVRKSLVGWASMTNPTFTLFIDFVLDVVVAPALKKAPEKLKDVYSQLKDSPGFDRTIKLYGEAICSIKPSGKEFLERTKEYAKKSPALHGLIVVLASTLEPLTQRIGLLELALDFYALLSDPSQKNVKETVRTLTSLQESGYSWVREVIEFVPLIPDLQAIRKELQKEIPKADSWPEWLCQLLEYVAESQDERIVGTRGKISDVISRMAERMSADLFTEARSYSSERKTEKPDGQSAELPQAWRHWGVVPKMISLFGNTIGQHISPAIQEEPLVNWVKADRYKIKTAISLGRPELLSSLEIPPIYSHNGKHYIKVGEDVFEIAHDRALLDRQYRLMEEDGEDSLFDRPSRRSEYAVTWRSGQWMVTRATNVLGGNPETEETSTTASVDQETSSTSATLVESSEELDLPEDILQALAPVIELARITSPDIELTAQLLEETIEQLETKFSLFTVLKRAGIGVASTAGIGLILLVLVYLAYRLFQRYHRAGEEKSSNDIEMGVKKPSVNINFGNDQSGELLIGTVNTDVPDTIEEKYLFNSKDGSGKVKNNPSDNRAINLRKITESNIPMVAGVIIASLATILAGMWAAGYFGMKSRERKQLTKQELEEVRQEVEMAPPKDEQAQAEKSRGKRSVGLKSSERLTTDNFSGGPIKIQPQLQSELRKISPSNLTGKFKVAIHDYSDFSKLLVYCDGGYYIAWLNSASEEYWKLKEVSRVTGDLAEFYGDSALKYHASLVCPDKNIEVGYSAGVGWGLLISRVKYYYSETNLLNASDYIVEDKPTESGNTECSALRELVSESSGLPLTSDMIKINLLNKLDRLYDREGDFYLEIYPEKVWKLDVVKYPENTSNNGAIRCTGILEGDGAERKDIIVIYLDDYGWLPARLKAGRVHAYATSQGYFDSAIIRAPIKPLPIAYKEGLVQNFVKRGGFKKQLYLPYDMKVFDPKDQIYTGFFGYRAYYLKVDEEYHAMSFESAVETTGNSKLGAEYTQYGCIFLSNGKGSLIELPVVYSKSLGLSPARLDENSMIQGVSTDSKGNTTASEKLLEFAKELGKSTNFIDANMDVVRNGSIYYDFATGDDKLYICLNGGFYSFEWSTKDSGILLTESGSSIHLVLRDNVWELAWEDKPFSDLFSKIIKIIIDRKDVGYLFVNTFKEFMKNAEAMSLPEFFKIFFSTAKILEDKYVKLKRFDLLESIYNLSVEIYILSRHVVGQNFEINLSTKLKRHINSLHDMTSGQARQHEVIDSIFNEIIEGKEIDRRSAIESELKSVVGQRKKLVAKISQLNNIKDKASKNLEVSAGDYKRSAFNALWNILESQLNYLIKGNDSEHLVKWADRMIVLSNERLSKLDELQRNLEAESKKLYREDNYARVFYAYREGVKYGKSLEEKYLISEWDATEGLNLNQRKAFLSARYSGMLSELSLKSSRGELEGCGDIIPCSDMAKGAEYYLFGRFSTLYNYLMMAERFNQDIQSAAHIRGWRIRNNYLDISYCLEAAASIVAKRESDFPIMPGDIITLAAMIYYAKLCAWSTRFDEISYNDVITKFYDAKNRLRPFRDALASKPENYKSLDEMLPATFFGDDRNTDYIKQFEDYEKSSARYDAASLLSSGLSDIAFDSKLLYDPLQIIHFEFPQFKLHVYFMQLSNRTWLRFFMPTKSFADDVNKLVPGRSDRDAINSVGMGFAWLGENYGLDDCEDNSSHSANCLPFQKFILEKFKWAKQKLEGQRRSYLYAQLKVSSQWGGGEAAPSLFDGTDFSSLTIGSHLTIPKISFAYGVNYVSVSKLGDDYIGLTDSFGEVSRITCALNVVDSSVKTGDFPFRFGNMESYLLDETTERLKNTSAYLKTSMYELPWYDKVIGILIPFYKELRQKSIDPNYEINIESILVDVVSLGFTLWGAGKSLGALWKQLNMSGKWAAATQRGLTGLNRIKFIALELTPKESYKIVREVVSVVYEIFNGLTFPLNPLTMNFRGVLTKGRPLISLKGSPIKHPLDYLSDLHTVKGFLEDTILPADIEHMSKADARTMGEIYKIGPDLYAAKDDGHEVGGEPFTIFYIKHGNDYYKVSWDENFNHFVKEDSDDFLRKGLYRRYADWADRRFDTPGGGVMTPRRVQADLLGTSDSSVDDVDSTKLELLKGMVISLRSARRDALFQLRSAKGIMNSSDATINGKKRKVFEMFWGDTSKDAYEAFYLNLDNIYRYVNNIDLIEDVAYLDKAGSTAGVKALTGSAFDLIAASSGNYRILNSDVPPGLKIAENNIESPGIILTGGKEKKGELVRPSDIVPVTMRNTGFDLNMPTLFLNAHIVYWNNLARSWIREGFRATGCTARSQRKWDQETKKRNINPELGFIDSSTKEKMHLIAKAYGLFVYKGKPVTITDMPQLDDSMEHLLTDDGELEAGLDISSTLRRDGPSPIQTLTAIANPDAFSFMVYLISAIVTDPALYDDFIKSYDKWKRAGCSDSLLWRWLKQDDAE